MSGLPEEPKPYAPPATYRPDPSVGADEQDMVPRVGWDLGWWTTLTFEADPQGAMQAFVAHRGEHAAVWVATEDVRSFGWQLLALSGIDERVLRLAISDPGAFLPRRTGLGVDQDEHEPVQAWAARAVLAVLSGQVAPRR